ncbi:hypothetical protein AA313_de0202609 [Arthrobotrys entomopaga]|nr:hypothetical protein AA313_de0202609 [Arthrobotrys entomopaga]
MPSTTLAVPTSPSSYDTLEKLLLCAEVVQYGESGQSFNFISSALKENPLLTSSPNYDPGRLSGDTLRERWRDIVRDEGFGGTDEGTTSGTAASASATTSANAPTTPAATTPARPRGSRVAMRGGVITSSSALPAPPPPPPPPPAITAPVPIGEKAARDLTRRIWENYQNMMKEQIHADERAIAQLLDEIGNLENERAREVEEMEAEEARQKEAAAAAAATAKAAAEQAKAEALAVATAATATTPKPTSPIVKKSPLPEPKKSEEPVVERQTSTQPSQPPAPNLTTLRTTPPSPSKASLQNILSDEPSPQPQQQQQQQQPPHGGSTPLERRQSYDPIRDGNRPSLADLSQRYPPPPPPPPPPQSAEPATAGYQLYEKPPATLRRLSGSSVRPHTPLDFGHHMPSTSPSRPPPLTPTGSRIGSFSGPASSPIHDQTFSNGHQSPINALNLAHPRLDDRTPRQGPLPSFSPTTPSLPPPQSSPSRSHFTQPLPPIHQLSPQRTPIQPPGYPAPMQRLPSQEYIPHHSPVSEHQPLHSPMSYGHTVPHSPFSHQSPLTMPAQSPRTPGFQHGTMPPPQYSPTHTPSHQQFYQSHIPPPQVSPSQTGFTPLQPAFTPQASSSSTYPTQQPSQENKLPPINTPTQLPPLQFTTPKPAEPGRPSSPLRPRPEEISPVLAPDNDESAGVPDLPLEERTGRKRKLAPAKATKSEPVDEPHESVDIHDEKPTKSTRGRPARGASKPRSTAASTRTRRGQSVSSVGSRTAEPEEMDVDEEPVAPTKEESMAPETIPEEPPSTIKSLKKRHQTRRQIQEGSVSVEPESAETPREAATEAEPATPRPSSFHLDMMAINVTTPTSAASALVKKFAQRANPLLNNVSAHRFANLFMKPVDERSAPGYSKIVYKPQDIKSIRACIKAGAAQNATGTPTLTPTPTTTDNPTMSFGTTPSTPTTTTAATTGMAFGKSAIVNSAQLEKEIWRMFANAVMYNKSNSPVAVEAREMARDVGIAIDNFRNAERIGERKAAEAAKEKEKEREKEREPRGGGPGRGRRGSLVKSEVLGDDESRRGEDDEEEEGDGDEREVEEEVEVENVRGRKAKGRPPAARSSRRGKKDKEGDVEMEEEVSDSEKTADEEEEEEEEEEEDSEQEDEEEEEDDDEEEEEEEEEEDEPEEETKATRKGKAAPASSRAKNVKTTRAAAAAAKNTTKGRGTRRGSPQTDADEEPRGRGRGAGRTRASKGR